MRRNGTVFLEHNYRHLPIHQGIYIDIFPFDKVPDSPRLQKAQRTLATFFNCCFMGKEVWQWKHCGRCEIDRPTDRGFWPCLVQRLVQTPLSKRAVYRLLRWSQSMFNGLKHATFYNMVLMPKDHIAVAAIEHPEQRPFGPLTVWAPSDLETYLRRHYRNLRRVIPKEEQQNHRPDQLSFA
jgi:lipopolysaccharide cholinephosphotransferase